MGAAGSGKSSILKSLLGEKDLKEYMIFNPDNFRSIHLANAPQESNIVGLNRVTETQDIAYLTKKIVEDHIKTISEQGKRPNIIFDGVTLQPPIKDLIDKKPLISSVAAFAPAGFAQIADRAEARALDQQAPPADKNRFMNTETLLQGHATISKNLLNSVPQSVDTTIYNTDIERGSKATIIGKIKAPEKILEVHDLRLMTQFFNKTNINPNATDPVSLIFKANNPLSLEDSALTQSTHPEHKANSLLNLIRDDKSSTPYTIELKNAGTTYARLARDNQNKIILNIIDKDTFKQKTSSETIEASTLRALSRQTILGLKESINKKDEGIAEFQQMITKYEGEKGLKSIIQNSKQLAHLLNEILLPPAPGTSIRPPKVPTPRTKALE